MEEKLDKAGEEKEDGGMQEKGHSIHDGIEPEMLYTLK